VDTSGVAAKSGGSSGRRKQTDRADKSLEAFRDALEQSVTVSRDRLEEVVDDAVSRGRMTRGDANELVSRLVTRSRDYTRDLEKLLDQLRRELDARVTTGRRRATEAAGRAARAARDAADRPLAHADRIRRQAGVSSGFPITAYDQLTATQIKPRLTGLSKADLRKVRTRERRGKARKGILAEIDRRLS
jgi:polyhydroxyalkanoate synthesis regulator phasin